MITTTLNFDAITDEDRGLFNGIQSEVLAQLQQTVAAAKGATADDKVGQFVAYLTSYSPDKLDKAGLGPQDFTWNTWKVFAYTAACIPPDHPAQDVLVQTLLALQAAEAPWKDLPEFGMFMRDEWNESPTFEAAAQSSPAPDDDDDDDDHHHHHQPLSLGEWVNLNSFAARVFRDVQDSFRTFGIWELRSGLEGGAAGDGGDGGAPLPQASADARVRVAAEWVIRAGDRLWRESLLGVWAAEEEAAAAAGGGRAHAGGRLIPATRGLNLERWGFWKRRLAEVRGGVRDGGARDAVGRALEVMAALERKSAEAL